MTPPIVIFTNRQQRMFEFPFGNGVADARLYRYIFLNITIRKANRTIATNLKGRLYRYVFKNTTKNQKRGVLPEVIGIRKDRLP
jgi:hypothetical protein